MTKDLVVCMSKLLKDLGVQVHFGPKAPPMLHTAGAKASSAGHGGGGVGGVACPVPKPPSEASEASEAAVGGVRGVGGVLAKTLDEVNKDKAQISKSFMRGLSFEGTIPWYLHSDLLRTAELTTLAQWPQVTFIPGLGLRFAILKPLHMKIELTPVTSSF